VTTAVAAGAAVAAAIADLAGRATGIADDLSDSSEKGGLWAALFPNARRLAVEALVIVVLLVTAGFLVYHFTTHTIRNTRPLGGANVDVAPSTADQGQMSFAADPERANALFGASNDTGREVVDVYTSRDGGKTWRRTDGPAVPGGSCAHGAPRVAVDSSGRQYLAFLAATFCGDALTPYLVVTSRAGPDEKWAPLVRVVPAAWKYGFDDAPSIAVDPRAGTVYLAWTRSLDKSEATVVVSSSSDHGRTWSAPTQVADDLRHAHLATLGVAPDGAVYIAGIDARFGVWIARSTNRGRTFTAPRTAAPLRANPAGGCALTAGEPLPQELRACAGPDPALVVGRDGVYVFYGDIGANQSPDVYVAALNSELVPRFRVPVHPADKGNAQQYFPAGTVDPVTGTLWACWYDTTFDPNERRSWYTCAASHDGRTWSPPERAASEPTPTVVLYASLGQGGLIPALAARNGVAHPFWADGRVIENGIDVFTAALRARDAFSHRP
jgi:hypothetical protein